MQTNLQKIQKRPYREILPNNEDTTYPCFHCLVDSHYLKVLITQTTA